MIVRGIGTGLMHGMSTTIVGMGIYMSYKDHRANFTITLAILFFDMMYHGAYNSICEIKNISYFAICIPIISYIVVILLQNKDKISALFKKNKQN